MAKKHVDSITVTGSLIWAPVPREYVVKSGPNKGQPGTVCNIKIKQVGLNFHPVPEYDLVTFNRDMAYVLASLKKGDIVRFLGAEFYPCVEYDQNKKRVEKMRYKIIAIEGKAEEGEYEGNSVEEGSIEEPAGTGEYNSEDIPF